MGMKKNRKFKDPAEAEEIKKKWQEYTEEQYKADLNDLDNHDGVVIHLEPDILESEVKRTLEIITMNKANWSERRNQIANSCWIVEKEREFQKKKHLFCFTDYAKSFDCVDHYKLWGNCYRDGNIRPPHLSPDKSITGSRSNS